MLKNYLRVALRNLLRHKGYSLINIVGLSVGMACCVLILLYVQSELSYDRFHEHDERIFRVTREWRNSDGVTNLHLGHVAPPIGPLLQRDFAEIEYTVRLIGGNRSLVSFEGNHFYEDRFYFADPAFFRVFSFEFVEGNPETVLQDPSNIVISESAARKYFGDAPAVGKVLRYRSQADLKVAAVMRDMPEASHFHADFFGSMLALEQFFGPREFESWGSNNYATYLLLRDPASAGQLAAKMPDFLDRHMTQMIIRQTGEPPSRKPSERTFLHLQPLTSIHLHSNLDSELEANGNIAYVYIFLAVAFFILLIACINFMNLATARSASRAKEIGLRKVVGAHRKRLIRQFLTESLLTAFLSLLLAVGLVLVALPWFSGFVERDLGIATAGGLQLLAGLVALVLFVGFVAGSYPAFYLSRFEPVTALKGMRRGGTDSSRFRTGLVVLQFAISIVLIIGVGIVRDQLEYCRGKDLGLDKENVVVLPAGGALLERFADLRVQLLGNPGIVNATASKRVPSGRLLDSSGAASFDGDNEQPITFRIANIRVDHEFVPTYGLELAAGRNFDVRMPTDSMQAFILNETAVRKIGWESPQDAVGKRFRYDQRRGQVIGVVRDFHYESLHQPITPVVLMISPRSFNSISVRIRPGSAAEVGSLLTFLEDRWRAFRPDYPFTYSFIDQRYDRLYQAEHKLEQIFFTFAAIALFIACLGLFGLAAYTAELRTKEIGIRKVLGASVGQLIYLLTRQYSLLVLAAALFAWPVAWFAMDRWLTTFAYRVDMHFAVFGVALLIAFVIALATVSLQAIKAAVANPVIALRSE